MVRLIINTNAVLVRLNLLPHYSLHLLLHCNLLTIHGEVSLLTCYLHSLFFGIQKFDGILVIPLQLFGGILVILQ